MSKVEMRQDEIIKEIFLNDTYSEIIKFITDTCLLYNIDDSHGLKHSLETLDWALIIIKEHLKLNLTETLKKIIILSCLLHDMCDKKYINEQEGIERIVKFLTDIVKIDEESIRTISFILLTMSYSTVVKNGYPDFKKDKELEICYHIVRNSDLLCSYDPERCIEYQIKKCNGSRKDGIIKMLDLFEKRIFPLISQGYFLDFITNYAEVLMKDALCKIENYKKELEKL